MVRLVRTVCLVNLVLEVKLVLLVPRVLEDFRGYLVSVVSRGLKVMKVFQESPEKLVDVVNPVRLENQGLVVKAEIKVQLVRTVHQVKLVKRVLGVQVVKLVNKE